jgi:hypothetical protein
MIRMAKSKLTMEKALRELRRFYDQGVTGKRLTEPPKRKLAKGEKPKRPKRRNVSAYGKELGVALSYVHKAIRFAELYDKRQFTALCTKIKQAGHPIGSSHISQLLAVRDDRQREKLLDDALANRWTYRQLARAREERFGVFGRKSRGRKLIPLSPADAQTQLLRDAIQLERRLEGLAEIQEAQKEYRLSGSSSLAQAIEKSRAVVSKLIGELTSARKRRRKRSL